MKAIFNQTPQHQMSRKLLCELHRIRMQFFLSTSIVFFIAACVAFPALSIAGTQSASPSVSLSAQQENLAPPSKPGCPSQNFSKFLTAFANDAEVQKAFVAQPLQSEFMDLTAEPEPKPITRMIGLSELRFPLMPSYRQQIEDGLKLSRIPLNSREIEVKLIKDDTDYQMLFFFRYDECWKLYRIRNDSL